MSTMNSDPTEYSAFHSTHRSNYRSIGIKITALCFITRNMFLWCILKLCKVNHHHTWTILKRQFHPFVSQSI